MIKRKTKEDIEDNIKTLAHKRDTKILEVDKIQKELLVLTEQYYELGKDYIKIECFRCHGVGWLKGDDNKKHICDLCGNKKYTWMKIFKNQEKKELIK